ncbi:MAG TPA: cupin domain-containing protein [Candidatus Eisenbacteria bacterium]
MNRHRVFTIVVSGLMLAAAAFADDAAKTTDTAKSSATPAATAATPAQAAVPATEHRRFLPGDFKWSDAPASLPKGAKVAVIHGDPNAPGIFAMRISMPAGYRIPPHSHPADEHVTVISGEFTMGLGDTWEESKGHALPAGSVSIMPKGTRHFAWSKVETVVQVHAMGPWGITYVNPQDDPRNKKQAEK